MKIFVYAPDYCHKSGGVSAMHYLMYLLQRAGQDIVTNAKVLDPVYDKKPLHGKKPDKSFDMIIAPEGIFLNGVYGLRLPILRWVLYFPGKNDGPARYAETEAVYHWCAEYEKAAIAASFHKSSGEFSLPHLIKAEYDDKEIVPRNKGDIFFVYKGKNMGTHPGSAVELVSEAYPKRHQILKLFREYNTLYCYDRYTAVITEALLSGMEVFVWDYDKSKWEKAALPEIKFRDYEADTEAVRGLLKDFNSRKVVLAPGKRVRYHVDFLPRLKQKKRDLGYFYRDCVAALRGFIKRIID